MSKIVTVAGVALRVPECPPSLTHMIPAFEHYVEQGDEMKALALAYKYRTPAMLIGTHGAGKNAAIREFARRIGAPLMTASLSEGTTTDHLIGAPQPTPVMNGEDQEKGFTITWLDGVLTTALRAGAILNLDEPNAADNRTLMRLADFLANGQRLSLYENPLNPAETISPKDEDGEWNGFFLVLTANPTDNGMYADRQRMDEAFLDRLAVHHMDYLGIRNPEAEIDAVEAASGADREIVSKLIALFNMIRKQSRMTDEELAASQAPPLYSTASTRAAIMVARFSTEVPIADAFELGYLNKVTGDDRVVIHRLFLEFFADPEMLDNAAGEVKPEAEF